MVLYYKRVTFMAYFLKKTNNKKGTYLQIYSSFYDPERRHTAVSYTHLKDLTHLLKIVDRFSKIGSETVLQKATVNEVVGEAVMYFRKRIPRNVTLD